MNEEEQKAYRKAEEDRINAFRIIADIFGCGIYDVECIIDIERNHPGAITEAQGYVSDINGEMNFGAVVEGAKVCSIEDIDDDFTELCSELSFPQEEAEQFIQSFWDMRIDDNCCAWGCISEYGDYNGDYEEENRSCQEDFASFVDGTMSKRAFLAECIKTLEGAIPDDEEEDEEDD